ncbi:MAG: SH3 domain-containing protein [Ktedonobacterales bacterium]
MRSSQASNQHGRVVKARQPENPDPLSVKAGEKIAVSEREDAWEGNPEWIWVWCTDPRGKSAWAPADLLEAVKGHGRSRARARYDYDAVELAVAAGDEVLVDSEKNGWYWSANAQGECGWVPIDHISLAGCPG